LFLKNIIRKENDIKYLQKQLQNDKEQMAILQIIKMNGWEEFDVSDETTKDLDFKLQMLFIGTVDEYGNQNFM
jgi:hypothetical protein